MGKEYRETSPVRVQVISSLTCGWGELLGGYVFMSYVNQAFTGKQSISS